MPIVAGAPAVLGYCNMLPVVKPVQAAASPVYSRTSATCCCLAQMSFTPPLSGNSHCYTPTRPFETYSTNGECILDQNLAYNCFQLD